MLWAFQARHARTGLPRNPPDVRRYSRRRRALRATAHIEAWRKSGKRPDRHHAPDTPPERRACARLPVPRDPAPADAECAGCAAQPTRSPAAAALSLKQQCRTGMPGASSKPCKRCAMQNSAVWVTGYQDKAPRLWVKGDGSEYITDAATLQDIRRGAFPFGSLQLRQGARAACESRCAIRCGAAVVRRMPCRFDACAVAERVHALSGFALAQLQADPAAAFADPRDGVARSGSADSA